ncbi:hypothetical protein ACTXT7_013741 [Hymenolepis weldensis]
MKHSIFVRVVTSLVFLKKISARNRSTSTCGPLCMARRMGIDSGSGGLRRRNGSLSEGQLRMDSESNLQLCGNLPFVRECYPRNTSRSNNNAAISDTPNPIPIASEIREYTRVNYNVSCALPSTTTAASTITTVP